jgi:Secretion system C-terminal sorting domain
MKKVLLSIAMCFSMIAMNAQTAVGTVVGNFTLTDINGNTQDLYSYLDAGKMVVIDVSATWCGPCWAYHGTGALNDFFLAHGPSGTNDAVALFIEGDPTTTSADLNGTGANTQGDWVTGESLPIVDLVAAADFENSGLVIPYYPVMYVICPNRVVIQSGVAGAIGTTALLESYVGTCPAPASAPVDPALLGYSGTTTSCGAFDLSVTLQNNGVDPLTACTITVTGLPTPIVYNWSGNLATYGYETVNLGTVNINAATTANIVVTSTDADATNSTINQTLNYIDATATTALPFATDFSTAGFPYANWQNINTDGDIGWEVITLNSAQADVIYMDTYNYSTTGELDHFVTAPFNLSGANTPSLSFKVANRRYNATYYDKLSVSVSTNCDGPFTQVWTKEGTALATGADYTSGAWGPTAASDWRNECIDLTSYANAPALFVRFTSENHYGNNVFVDDIAVQNAACSTIGVDEAVATSVTMAAFPNPTSSATTFNYSIPTSGDVNISVINMLGERVMNLNKGTLGAGSYTEVLDFNNLSAGLYLINLTSNNKVSTLRLTVSK